MKQAVLLGNAGTKRTDYFVQAAAQAKLPVLFVEWKDFEKWKQQLSKAERFVKIDPPLWNSSSLEELDLLAEDYKAKLQKLDCMSRVYSLEFLNHPLVIAELLDKRACKKKLEKAGLAVTEMLRGENELEMPEKGSGKETEKSGTAPSEKLLEQMQKKGIYQVFIKPVNGSGAAGVSAFRWQPVSGQMVLYTCALRHPEYGLVNTKCLRRFTKPEEIISLLDGILKLDCVVERWYAKAQYQGFSYDLRAVVLDGKIDYLLGRLSRGPVTNLHLNNRPLKAEKLGIPLSVLEDIDRLCRRAADCFTGLRCAGIDILLERGSLKPRIIEMNAQGDLIYQDLFHENRIYRHQAEMMLNWLDGRDCKNKI